MKNLLLFLLQLAFVFTAVAQKQNEPAKAYSVAERKFLPNTLIVKFKTANTATQKKMQAGRELQLKGVALNKLQQKFPVKGSKSNFRTFQQSDPAGLDRIFELNFSGEKNLLEVIRELNNNPDIEYAEPSYIRRTFYDPNDPGYQLHMQEALRQVGANLAWNLIRNGPSVVVAIVDSGSDLDHPDLAANIKLNTNDPVNGVDDDGNGYVDDYRGWDFVGATGSNPTDDNDPDVKSTAGDHGVHVSGIASAVTNNATGVASIAFNAAKLLIVKVGPDDNGTDIYRGYEGIKYAADNGASIINCSWGGEGRSLYEQDVINYVISKGCLVVAAAGNNGNQEEQYPAAYAGVLAVANVDSDDKKVPSSNFGEYVSISAPGTDIYSTTINGDYTHKSGTSMSTPMVSSAAALVKSYRPGLTMQQVAEQLRGTSDNINSINPIHAGKIGKGRLNVYRALTESPPSIRLQSFNLNDQGGGTIPAGETFDLFLDLKNFLYPVTNLSVKLTSASPDVIISNAELNVPFLGELETASNVGPFYVQVKSGVADNTPVSFRIEYSANNGSYIDYETFTIIVSRDFINLSTNSIETTVTSMGRIGFLTPGNLDGTKGFRYKNQQLLYEASLMIGTSPNQVSNNARSFNEQFDEHFVKKVRVHAVQNDVTTEVESEFDDSNSPNPINVRVKQSSFISNTSEGEKYIITEYEVKNTNTTSLNNVFVGLFTDWDIDEAATNATQLDPDNQLAYVYSKKTSSLPYAGVKLLTSRRPIIYYPLSLDAQPIKDNFTIAEKYTTLTHGVEALGIGHNTSSGADVSFVSGNGPFMIPPNGSVKIAFALIAADNLDELKQVSAGAQQLYNTIRNLEPIPDVTNVSLFSYPNPVVTGNTAFAQVSLPEAGLASLDIYNVMGMRVKTIFSNKPLIKGTSNENVDITNLSSGIYFLRLRYKNTTKVQKLVIQ